jgi:hypothetical protein
LPVALLIQFTNVTNLFYVANVALQFTPQVATNSPMATLVPLCFVLLVGITKEFIADFKRWQEDRKTNGVIYKKIVDKNDVNRTVTVRSDQLKVGDII